MFIGVSIGALIGFLGSGGREMFFSGGWIDALIGVMIGGVISMGLGLINHVILLLKK